MQRYLAAVCGVAMLMAPAILYAGDESQADPKESKNAHPRVKMETSLGTIILELNAEKAPETVENFLKYAEDKYYEGTIFHRVMSGFMIQGGGYTPDIDEKREGLRRPIKLESDNGLSNVRGSIAMARTGVPDSATSQFFINVVDNPRLDYNPSEGRPNGYAVFGKVVEGMDVVDKIRNTKVQEHPKYPGGAVVPVETVLIKSVTRLESE